MPHPITKADRLTHEQREEALTFAEQAIVRRLKRTAVVAATVKRYGCSGAFAAALYDEAMARLEDEIIRSAPRRRTQFWAALDQAVSISMQDRDTKSLVAALKLEGRALGLARHDVTIRPEEPEASGMSAHELAAGIIESAREIAALEAGKGSGAETIDVTPREKPPAQEDGEPGATGLGSGVRDGSTQDGNGRTGRGLSEEDRSKRAHPRPRRRP